MKRVICTEFAMWPSCLPPPSASLPSSCPQTHSPSHVAGHSRWTADIHLASCARRCSPHKSLFICEIALPALYSAASQASLANPSPLHSSCPADSRFGTDSSKGMHTMRAMTMLQTQPPLTTIRLSSPSLPPTTNPNTVRVLIPPSSRVRIPATRPQERGLCEVNRSGSPRQRIVVFVAQLT